MAQHCLVLKPFRLKDVGSGTIDVLINAVVGFLNAIIQAIATPFLGALDYLQSHATHG